MFALAAKYNAAEASPESLGFAIENSLRDNRALLKKPLAVARGQ
jgi:hypothetical protein